MQVRPLDKRMLIHKVEWYPYKLTTGSGQKIEIDKVRLSPKWFYSAEGAQQSTGSNYRMFYDCRESSKLPDGSIPQFAIGDTIKMIEGPVNYYPRTFKITMVLNYFDIDGTSLHHIELDLR